MSILVEEMLYSPLLPSPDLLADSHAGLFRAFSALGLKVLIHARTHTLAHALTRSSSRLLWFNGEMGKSNPTTDQSREAKANSAPYRTAPHRTGTHRSSVHPLWFEFYGTGTGSTRTQRTTKGHQKKKRRFKVMGGFCIVYLETRIVRVPWLQLLLDARTHDTHDTHTHNNTPK